MFLAQEETNIMAFTVVRAQRFVYMVPITDKVSKLFDDQNPKNANATTGRLS